MQNARRDVVVFENRQAAGRLLAERLNAYSRKMDAVVFGLPDGGISVAFEVAESLDLQLDAMVVRRLEAPGRTGSIIGALATGGVTVFEMEMVKTLALEDGEIERAALGGREDLIQWERRYRLGRPEPEVRHRTVIVVDEGIAGGTMMRAAVMALRKKEAARVVVATPVASPHACQELKGVADEFVSLLKPELFLGIELFYEEYEPTDDRESRRLLDLARNRFARELRFQG